MKKFKKAVSVILTLLLLFSTLTLFIGAEALSPPEDTETGSITGLEEEPESTAEPTAESSPAPTRMITGGTSLILLGGRCESEMPAPVPLRRMYPFCWTVPVQDP